MGVLDRAVPRWHWFSGRRAGVLAELVLAGLLLAGCYSPSLRDCTVACSSPGDCAGDQVCGNDGLCAAPGVAGQCGSLPNAPIDAGLVDAEPIEPPPGDAMPPPPDAPPGAMVSLRVQVEGRGSIVVNGIGTCSTETPQKGDCTYQVPTGVARTVRAVGVKPDEVFTRWASLVCAGQSSTCTFTPYLLTSITARFERDRVEVR